MQQMSEGGGGDHEDTPEPVSMDIPSPEDFMTPEEYRARWGLPQDYPMVAPNYAKKRSDFAKKMGLGKRSG